MAKYHTELLCPDCGGVIEEDDCYNTETTHIEDDGQFAEIKHCTGYCIICEKQYKYDEVYVLVGYTNIKEEK